MPRFDETLSNQAWPRKGQADIWRRVEEKKMRKVTSLLAVASLVGVATLVLAGGSASAQSTCDFLTGGGFIIRPSGAKANFGVAGGCKGGSPTWAIWNTPTVAKGCRCSGPASRHTSSISWAQAW